jgi:parallel beta-helix repeat protein
MSRLSPAILLLAIAGALAATPAEAVQRVFVASFGNDANTATNCGFTNPCRGFTAALTVVDPGGEVVALDAAGYGVVNITKSVTLTANPGFYAGISASAGNAVSIVTAGVNVILRGLNINGIGAQNGVFMNNGASLQVENCVISNFSTSGIAVNTPAVVRITDTTIRGNAANGVILQNGASGTITRATISGNGNAGVFLFATVAGTVTTAEVADSTLDGNNQGFLAFVQNVSAAMRASVHGSRVVNNTTHGIGSNSGSGGGSVSVTASNNIISNNDVAGIVVFDAGKVWASGNTVSGNDTGFWNTTGIFESAGNNAMRNNITADTSGTITAVATK